MKENALIRFRLTPLETILQERQAFHKAFLAFTMPSEYAEVLATFVGGNFNIRRVHRGDIPPPGWKLLRASVTHPVSGVVYTFWTLESP